MIGRSVEYLDLDLPAPNLEHQLKENRLVKNWPVFKINTKVY